MRFGMDFRTGSSSTRSTWHEFFSCSNLLICAKDILPEKLVTNVSLPCHSAWFASYRRRNRSHRASVGCMGICDGEILRLDQTKYGAEPQTRTRQHRQSDSRNHTTRNGEDAVWSYEKALAQAKTRLYVKR